MGHASSQSIKRSKHLFKLQTKHEEERYGTYLASSKAVAASLRSTYSFLLSSPPLTTAGAKFTWLIDIFLVRGAIVKPFRMKNALSVCEHPPCQSYDCQTRDYATLVR